MSQSIQSLPIEPKRKSKRTWRDWTWAEWGVFMLYAIFFGCGLFGWGFYIHSVWTRGG